MLRCAEKLLDGTEERTNNGPTREKGIKMLQTPNKNIYGWVYIKIGEIQLLVFLPIAQVSLLYLKQM